MKNRDDSLLRKIFEYCIETEETIYFFGDEIDFKNNKIFRNAACMPVMQIGELCKLISDSTKESYTQIDWRGWCGIRDILAHQYTNLDYKKTWLIITVDLPKLKEEINKILDVINKEAISRISDIIIKNNITNVNASDVYHRIVDDTGISINEFSDDKIVEFINDMM